MYDFSHLGQSFQIHFYDSIATELVAATELVVFTAVISWELMFSFLRFPITLLELQEKTTEQLQTANTNEAFP